LKLRARLVENIDPVYLLQPVIVIVIAFLPVAYFWFKKRTFTSSVIFYSLLAYFLAISGKSIIQDVVRFAGIQTNSLVVLGVYYGLQTALLEVGLAYVFAKYGVGNSTISAEHSAPYGTGLAFWENGILLGAFSLLNIAALYVILGIGGAGAVGEYNSLVVSDSSLFYPVSQALPLVALGILERISSIIAHFCWGYLCVAAAYYKKTKYLMIALPMGFLPDFLVPFAGVLTIYVFEALEFALATLFLVSVVIVAKIIRKKGEPGLPPSIGPTSPKPTNRPSSSSRP
jgi:hypothetical protein